jgi:hypothetical protein
MKRIAEKCTGRSIPCGTFRKLLRDSNRNAISLHAYRARINKKIKVLYRMATIVLIEQNLLNMHGAYTKTLYLMDDILGIPRGNHIKFRFYAMIIDRWLPILYPNANEDSKSHHSSDSKPSKYHGTRLTTAKTASD